MKKLISISLCTIALLMFELSCKKDPLGPDITGIYGPVTVVDTLKKSAATVDFSKDESVFFTASFEKETDWVLTITGKTSGATKTFEGISKNIDKTNALWNGTASDVPSFQKETVTARLTFRHTADTFKTTLVTTGLKNLDKNDVLVTNFSTFKVIHPYDSTKNNPVHPNADWPISLTTTSQAGISSPADGGKYLYMSGKPWQHINGDVLQGFTPYVTYLNITAAHADTDYGTYYPLLPDSNKVIFNIMVYGNGPTSKTWLEVTFMEDGVTARHINIYPTWVGWKLLSYSYASLLDNIATPGHPEKLQMVTFLLLSTAVPPESTTVSVAFDHPVFTTNHPYQP